MYGGLLRPIGVWAFTAASPGSGTLTFRYDQVAAATLGVPEDQLRIFRNDGSGWQNVTGSIDTGANTITTQSGTVPTGQFAVATFPSGTVVILR